MGRDGDGVQVRDTSIRISFTHPAGVSTVDLTRFAALVRAQALEDAAKIVDAAQPMGRIVWTAAEIRALKDQP